MIIYGEKDKANKAASIDLATRSQCFRKAMDRIKKVLEIDDLHPHMFRYSHATVLHELGVDDKTIQHWEGHANQATTANIYIKNTQTMTDRAEAILSDFASGNG